MPKYDWSRSDSPPCENAASYRFHVLDERFGAVGSDLDNPVAVPDDSYGKPGSKCPEHGIATALTSAPREHLRLGWCALDRQAELLVISVLAYFHARIIP